jgi:hypothetical protein
VELVNECVVRAQNGPHNADRWVSDESRGKNTVNELLERLYDSDVQDPQNRGDNCLRSSREMKKRPNHFRGVLMLLITRFQSV